MPGSDPVVDMIQKNAQAHRAYRVLIVDDEEMIRDVSTAMLEELGFETVCVSNGEEAIALFREKSDCFDAVLLDQIMPGMDGAAVFRELRSINADVKILLASGFSQHEVSERFQGMGLNGFLSKPFTMKNLSRELSRILDGSDS